MSEKPNEKESPVPSTSATATKNIETNSVECPSELFLLRRSNNAPIRRGSHIKNGRIASSAAASRSPSLERNRQLQCQQLQTLPFGAQAASAASAVSAGRCWWRRRSVAAIDDATATATANGSIPVTEDAESTSDLGLGSGEGSSAGTPASGRSAGGSDFLNMSGTHSKSSSRSGSSRSAFRIFKTGSQLSQSSKAQIVCAMPFSYSPSLGRHAASTNAASAASTASQCAAMRSKSAVPNATTTTAGAASKNVTKFVHVHTLTKQNIIVSVERKCQVWDVFHSCCVHLGIDDDRLFGLAMRRPCEGFGGAEDRPRHEYFFLDPEQKISKYVPKEAKSSSGKSSVASPLSKLKGRSRACGGGSPKPMIVLYMRVRVYVRRIDAISCDVALQHYYLQLRENLIDQWSAGPHSGASEETCWELAALAILTDRGRAWRSMLADSLTSSFSFRAEQYFPLWVINSRGLEYIQDNMPKVLRGYGCATTTASSSGASSLGGCGGTFTPSTSSSSAAAPSIGALTETDAMFQFCQEASRGPFALNCHLYGLRRQKTDILNNALISITDKGVDLWDVSTQGERILLRSLTWSKMSCLSFDSKRITIAGLDGSRLVFYAESESKARYLLVFCREVHQQLIQINTSFVLNRPPSSPLLPPGWGMERLIDASKMARASLIKRFNSAEYSGILPPVFSPRGESNPPEISLYNNNRASNVVPSSTKLPIIANVNGNGICGQHSMDNKRPDDNTKENEAGIVNGTGTLPVQNTSGCFVCNGNNGKEIEPKTSATNSEGQAVGGAKVRRFKKAGYQRRASSPITVTTPPARRTTSSDDATPCRMQRSPLEDDVLREQNHNGIDALEYAMNNVPSPQKFAITSDSEMMAGGNFSENTKATPPISCLKRPNSSKQMQICNSINTSSLSNDQQVTNNSTGYTLAAINNVQNSTPYVIPNYKQNHLNMDGRIATSQIGQKPQMGVTAATQPFPGNNNLNLDRQQFSRELQLIDVDSQFTGSYQTAPTKLKPPPQYSEAIEQLKRRTNGTQNGVQMLASQFEQHRIGQQQQQQSHLHYQPEVVQVIHTTMSYTPGINLPHNSHPQQVGSPKRLNQQQQQPPSMVNGQLCQRTTFARPATTRSNSIPNPPPYGVPLKPMINGAASKRPNSHCQQRNETTSRWKTTGDEIDSETMMQLQKSFDESRRQNSTEHAKEPSISNTEKFKNYPMMKALWAEARHDLAGKTGVEARAVSRLIERYDEINRPTTGSQDNNNGALPPSYIQYIQQQIKATNKFGNSPIANAAGIGNGIVEKGATGGGYAPNAVDEALLDRSVMDLPPPPPYPRDNDNNVQALKASIVM